MLQVTNNQDGTYTVQFELGAVRFFNGCPHSFNLRPDAVLQIPLYKCTGGEDVAVIPPSGTRLAAKLTNTVVRELGNGVTICKRVAESCDPLPPAARRADFILCSPMYATAYRLLYQNDSAALLVSRDLCIDEQTGAPVGCRGFAIM